MSLDPRTDPRRDEDDRRRLGPDDDRNEGATMRLLARVLGDRAYANRRKGGVHRHLLHRVARPDGAVLSTRQVQVLECASHGLGVIETADVLGISSYTVAGHRVKAQRALGGKTLEHTVALALRRGLIR